MVSVIIMVYNRTSYLPAAIQSALDQTYRNIEVIVADDASTTDIAGLVRKFSDPRVRYRRNETNLRMARNLSATLRETRGEFFANLNDDDLWEPDFLEKVVPPMAAHPEATVGFSDHFVVKETGEIDPAATETNSRVWKRTALPPGLHQPFHRIALADLSVPAAMAAVFRRSAIDPAEIAPEADFCYDRWLLYLACRLGGAAYYVPERLTRYRVHKTSETSTTDRVQWTGPYIFCFQQMLADERLSALKSFFQAKLAETYTNRGLALLRSGRPGEGRPWLLKGLRQGHRQRAMAGLALSLLPASLAASLMNRMGSQT